MKSPCRELLRDVNKKRKNETDTKIHRGHRLKNVDMLTDVDASSLGEP